MLYFIYDNASTKIEFVSTEIPAMECNYKTRHDLGCWAEAKGLAHLANEAAGEDKYIATDAGESVSPRYDVIERPQVGDDVSYAFNGDSYPCGTITRISESLRVITTSTGAVFYRRRQTGTWIKKGGTWALIPGHVKRQNPHF